MRKQKYYKCLYTSRRRSMKMMLARLFYILGHNSVCIKCILQSGKDKQKQRKTNSSNMHSAFASGPKKLKVMTGNFQKRTTDKMYVFFFTDSMSSLMCLSFTLKIPNHSSMSSTQFVAASSPCST